MHISDFGFRVSGLRNASRSPIRNPQPAIGNLLAILLAALALDCSAGEATRDWPEALAIIRRVALDKTESDEHRANAVAAHAKLLIGRGQHDDALKLCNEILQGPEKAEVASAALRAGGLVERNRCGHLRAELDFVDAWSRGANAQAALAVAQELSREAVRLGLLAAKAMVPGPVALKLPHWAEAPRVSLPKFDPPHWHARLTFPPLKEASK